jgi:hypothetical protein
MHELPLALHFSGFTAERLNLMQAEVRLTSGNPKTVIAALQLLSDKTLLNNRKLSGHPIRATLLNVKDTRRLRVSR